MILSNTENESKIDLITNPGSVMQQMAVLLTVLLAVLSTVLIQK
jgi:hypothetical protein